MPGRLGNGIRLSAPPVRIASSNPGPLTRWGILRDRKISPISACSVGSNYRGSGFCSHAVFAAAVLVARIARAASQLQHLISMPSILELLKCQVNEARRPQVSHFELSCSQAEPVCRWLHFA